MLSLAYPLIAERRNRVDSVFREWPPGRQMKEIKQIRELRWSRDVCSFPGILSSRLSDESLNSYIMQQDSEAGCNAGCAGLCPAAHAAVPNSDSPVQRDERNSFYQACDCRGVVPERLTSTV